MILHSVKDPGSFAQESSIGRSIHIIKLTDHLLTPTNYQFSFFIPLQHFSYFIL
jgi:hypothetical protein